MLLLEAGRVAFGVKPAAACALLLRALLPPLAAVQPRGIKDQVVVSLRCTRASGPGQHGRGAASQQGWAGLGRLNGFAECGALAMQYRWMGGRAAQRGYWGSVRNAGQTPAPVATQRGGEAAGRRAQPSQALRGAAATANTGTHAVPLLPPALRLTWNWP